MRVVFIRSNPVSPYPRLEKTANTLCKYGHKVQVLAWDRGEKYSQKKSYLQLSDCKVKITRFGIPGNFGGGFKKNFISLLKFQIKVFIWLFKNRKFYDVIHAYDLDTGYIALKAAKLLRKKIVYDIADYYVDSHGFKGKKIGKFVQRLENNIINKADAVIICTEQRKQQIAGTNPKMLYVIHNSPIPIKNDKINTNGLNKTSNKLKIVYVGILASGRFIKEIADVVINRDDCEFHIGGFGLLEDYFKELSRKHGNIFFYGKLPYNKTIELEKKCDVMTAIYDPKVPNHFYAAPNKFYEALMLGKPLIMAKNTGMSDIVNDYKIGEVIDYNRESLNEAINRLIDKRKEWNKISNISRRLYDEKFSWNIMEKRLIDLYSKL